MPGARPANPSADHVVQHRSQAQVLDVLVDFWAAWCGPCRMFAPIYEAASTRHPDITFAKLDTEAEQALSAAAGITAIPTLMAFRGKTLLFAQPGALNATALEEVIQEVKDLELTNAATQDSQLPA